MWYVSKPHLIKVVEIDGKKYRVTEMGKIEAIDEEELQRFYKPYLLKWHESVMGKYTDYSPDEQYERCAPELFEYETTTPKGRFYSDYIEAHERAKNNKRLISKMVTAILLPNGAIEIIVNSEEIQAKVNYYMSAYDDDMRLKTNKDIQMIGWLFV